MVKLIDTLKVTIPKFESSGKPDDTAKVYDTIFGYVRNIFDNVSIEWINGGPERGNCVNREICSTIYFRSAQSGQSDLVFPPSSLLYFDHVPINISLSPAMVDERCHFMNFYSEGSLQSGEDGILSSFSIFDFKVFILVILLWIMLFAVKSTRVKRRTHGVSFRNLRRLLWRLFNGQVGSLISMVCHYSLYLIFLLLSASFRTDYSIEKREEPVINLDDMLQSRIEVGSFRQLHCYQSTHKEHYKRRLHPIDIGTLGIDDYLGTRLDENKIVLFESSIRLPTSVRFFCSLMIDVKGSTNFHIHIGTKYYYDTFRLIVYNNRIDSVKKRYISKIAYACIENGYCIDALDQATRSTFRRFAQNAEKAQCIDQHEMSYGQSYGHHPIRFTNMIDLLTLFLLIIGFSCSLFIVRYRKCH